MISFKISEDDIVIIGGDLQLVEGDDEKCQCIERAITTRIEEWFLNCAHGMDYLQLKEKNPDIERIKFDITEAAMQEESLKYIKEISIEFDGAKRFAKIDLVGVLIDETEIEVREVNV